MTAPAEPAKAQERGRDFMAAKKKAPTVKQRLAALEKQWVAGLLAPGEALQLCLESGMPEDQWPKWIVPAAVPIHPQPEIRKQKPKPMTGPQQTRFLAAHALRAEREHGLSRKEAACAAVAAYASLNTRPRYPEGVLVVNRVLKEMNKQPARQVHFALSNEQKSRLIPHLRKNRS